MASAATFDVVVIDEAAQGTEAVCWLPLLRGQRAVLAGDHRQLPPTIKSDAAASGGLATTLFERLAEQHGPSVMRMLSVQYRMNSHISDWASAAMYGGELRPGEGVGERLLGDLLPPGVSSAEREDD